MFWHFSKAFGFFLMLGTCLADFWHFWVIFGKQLGNSRNFREKSRNIMENPEKIPDFSTKN